MEAEATAARSQLEAEANKGETPVYAAGPTERTGSARKPLKRRASLTEKENADAAKAAEIKDARDHAPSFCRQFFIDIYTFICGPPSPKRITGLAGHSAKSKKRFQLAAKLVQLQNAQGGGHKMGLAARAAALQ